MCFMCLFIFKSMYTRSKGFINISNANHIVNNNLISYNIMFCILEWWLKYMFCLCFCANIDIVCNQTLLYTWTIIEHHCSVCLSALEREKETWQIVVTFFTETCIDMILTDKSFIARSSNNTNNFSYNWTKFFFRTTELAWNLLISLLSYWY